MQKQDETHYECWGCGATIERDKYCNCTGQVTESETAGDKMKYTIKQTEITEKRYLYFDCPNCGTIISNEGDNGFGNTVKCDNCKAVITIKK